MTNYKFRGNFKQDSYHSKCVLFKFQINIAYLTQT